MSFIDFSRHRVKDDRVSSSSFFAFMRCSVDCGCGRSLLWEPVRVWEFYAKRYEIFRAERERRFGGGRMWHEICRVTREECVAVLIHPTICRFPLNYYFYMRSFCDGN